MRTYVIAIVGLDGAGKTTQARALAEALRAAGHDATSVHPSNDLIALVPGGERIKRRLVGWLHRPTLASRATRRLLMVLLGYPFALLSIVLARYRYRGRIVVFDRYRYQFLHDCYGPLAPALVHTLPSPDRTIRLTADPGTLRGRTSGRDSERPREYYRAGRRFHDRLGAELGWETVRTDRSVERVGERVFDAVAGSGTPIEHAAGDGPLTDR
ncbi:hypothetical protein [Halalkalicoccus tibetensis]|uniref:Thymidylate kinase-like domain-containing protein n=1 Tax=Halalkalicoccus tibetensis TaxID=175632 RepID=A0ABD5UYJ3_9EURY